MGVPATIDNDVAGTDTTIGFDTAVHTGLFT
ncbi:MAG: 6-phosphofructokinase, partial [Thermoproteota archaeon]